METKNAVNVVKVVLFKGGERTKTIFRIPLEGLSSFEETIYDDTSWDNPHDIEERKVVLMSERDFEDISDYIEKGYELDLERSTFERQAYIDGEYQGLLTLELHKSA